MDHTNSLKLILDLTKKPEFDFSQLTKNLYCNKKAAELASKEKRRLEQNSFVAFVNNDNNK